MMVLSMNNKMSSSSSTTTATTTTTTSSSTTTTGGVILSFHYSSNIPGFPQVSSTQALGSNRYMGSQHSANDFISKLNNAVNDGLPPFYLRYCFLLLAIICLAIAIVCIFVGVTGYNDLYLVGVFGGFGCFIFFGGFVPKSLGKYYYHPKLTQGILNTVKEENRIAESRGFKWTVIFSYPREEAAIEEMGKKRYVAPPGKVPPVEKPPSHYRYRSVIYGDYPSYIDMKVEMTVHPFSSQV